MFKSKKWFYLLIPMTLLIWSVIGYQIYTGLNPELPPIEEGVYTRFRESEKEIDLIELNLPDYDPFLDKNHVKRIPKSSNKKRTSSTKKKILWPQVNFKGIVKDKSSSRTVVALELNGTAKLMSPGQVIDSVLLVKATSEYITLKYKNESKRFDNK